MHVLRSHWLRAVPRELSPNCDARTDPSAIELVVLHGISLPPGEFGGAAIGQLFCNTLDCSADARLADLAGVEVSSHVLIDRTGAITQFVPFDARAWHAGVSRWRGRSGCNDFAIGIELEGTDDVAYTDAQYAGLAAVLPALFRRYPRLGPDAVVGHSDIAPGRKTDPGPSFDWRRLYGSLS